MSFDVTKRPTAATLSNYGVEAVGLKKWADDLKYLDGMHRSDFELLFFHGSSKDYLQTKWDLFCSDKLRFIWGVSFDTLERIMYYINFCKEREEE